MLMDDPRWRKSSMDSAKIDPKRPSPCTCGAGPETTCETLASCGERGGLHPTVQTYRVHMASWREPSHTVRLGCKKGIQSNSKYLLVMSFNYFQFMFFSR